MQNISSQKASNFYIFKITLVASVGGFLFGYDLVIIAGALSYLSEYFQLSPAMKGFAVSSAILGSIAGPLFGLWFTERIGRRKTMMIAGICFMVSSIGSALAFTIWDFAFWRFIGGIGIGLAMKSSPIYIAELSPPDKRGSLVNVNQLSNVIGINLAVIAGYFFSFDSWGWRWMFGSAAICMPLMIEPLIFRANNQNGGYMVDGDIKKIIPLVRQAVELGADIIKADSCDNLEEYHKIVEIAGETPVLVRGGGKAPDEAIIVRTKKLVEQGVSGIVYGRNIIQHKNPALITKALMGIVHEGKSIEESLETLEVTV